MVMGAAFFRVDDTSIFLVVVFAILAGGIIAHLYERRARRKPENEHESSTSIFMVLPSGETVIRAIEMTCPSRLSVSSKVLALSLFSDTLVVPESPLYTDSPCHRTSRRTAR